MYPHILVPVDLADTEKVKRSVATARALLAPQGKITLLNVVAPFPTSIDVYVPADIVTQAFENAKTKLAALSQEIGIKDAVTLQGGVGRSIVDWADEHAVDCIVIPSHQPELSDILLGSTAAWVVRHAQCSVHVLRKRAAD
ncbi:universal stress protein [Pseudaestuariivita atlantica]|uniref:UspA domain-containing protein n=1 Tax=Pseudaestuariivita atlantica TaxID=1317121 RepID=A0A0L1JU74_9RHOB|nr:universal stress protein [Pseudaestuariivita atlantica]KNG95242.1 hypothetical protein ATO11_00960 [Pseudaestuariivita atlantica]